MLPPTPRLSNKPWDSISTTRLNGTKLPNAQRSDGAPLLLMIPTLSKLTQLLKTLRSVNSIPNRMATPIENSRVFL